VFRHFLGVLAVLFLVPAPASADNGLDFDGDGVAEIFSVVASGSAMRWRATGSAGDRNLDTEFGLITDTPIPGYWLSADEIALAYVRFDQTKNSIIWKALMPDGLIAERAFGKSGDYVISGADFDGNGIADAAIMRVRNKRYTWIIRYDIFAQIDAKQRKVTFGRFGQRIFFARGTNGLEWLGTFGPGKTRHRKARLSLRNPREKGSLKGQFVKALAQEPRPRPIPVQAPDGTDHVAFALQDASDTQIVVHELEGARLVDVTFPGKSAVIAGDFDVTDPGEELLLATSDRLMRYNPFSGIKAELTPVSGTLVGAFRIEQFAGPIPTAAPTVAPTATVAATPTPTPTP
jgi:hypothetical protein